jgi:threonine/homoserine/homoserine lactone efflux protein
MQAYMSLSAIAVVLAAGTLSPGPCFVYVARNAVALSRGHGFATALGMGSGVFIYSMIALLGLHAVFTAVPVVFWVLKIAGGLYLVYLAAKILHTAGKPFAQDMEAETTGMSLWKAYTFGLFTQLSNPKTAVVFAGVFSALLPPQIPAYFYVVIPILGFCIDVLWYSFVTLVLSSEPPRKAFLRFKPVFDGVAGAIMGLLGLKLIFGGK